MFSASKIFTARDRALGRKARSERDLPLVDLCEALMLSPRREYRYEVREGGLAWAGAEPEPRFVTARLRRAMRTVPGLLEAAIGGTALEVLPQAICDDIQFTVFGAGGEVLLREWEDVSRLVVESAEVVELPTGDRVDVAA